MAGLIKSLNITDAILSGFTVPCTHVGIIYIHLYTDVCVIVSHANSTGQGENHSSPRTCAHETEVVWTRKVHGPCTLLRQRA